MIQYYQKFLEYLGNGIEKYSIESSNPSSSSYPVSQLQRKAQFRIAFALGKIDEFEKAILQLENVIREANEQGNDKNVIIALCNMGNLYQEWARVNVSQAVSLLDQSIEFYKKAIQKLPEEDIIQRIKVLTDLGDVKLLRHQKEREITSDNRTHLMEAIACYEKAQNLILQSRSVPFYDKQRVVAILEKLYLIQEDQSPTSRINEKIPSAEKQAVPINERTNQ